MKNFLNFEWVVIVVCECIEISAVKVIGKTSGWNRKIKIVIELNQRELKSKKSQNVLSTIQNWNILN